MSFKDYLRESADGISNIKKAAKEGGWKVGSKSNARDWFAEQEYEGKQYKVWWGSTGWYLTVDDKDTDYGDELYNLPEFLKRDIKRYVLKVKIVEGR